MQTPNEEKPDLKQRIRATFLETVIALAERIADKSEDVEHVSALGGALAALMETQPTWSEAASVAVFEAAGKLLKRASDPATSPEHVGRLGHTAGEILGTQVVKDVVNAHGRLEPRLTPGAAALAGIRIGPRP